jgi:hypothetical protein
MRLREKRENFVLAGGGIYEKEKKKGGADKTSFPVSFHISYLKIFSDLNLISCYAHA